MSLDSLNNAISSMGGSWVKLNSKEHGVLEGKVVEFEERDRRTPDGDIVYKKGTQNARKEWLFTLEVEARENDDDDGLRKFAANESAQRAIAEAVKESGKQAEVGGTLKIAVKEDPEDTYSQATYQARYTPPVEVIFDADEF